VGEWVATLVGMGSLTDALGHLGRDTRWSCQSEIAIDGDVGHPQGLTRWGDGWLLSAIHPDRLRGELITVSSDGQITGRTDVTDGDRFHPGGLHGDIVQGCVVAVAEYRPDSTTSVWHIDPPNTPTLLFRFLDHLGAICDLGDGTLFAMSWGSRTLYRLDQGGRVLERRTNPVHFLDFQDLQLDGDRIVTTGVAGIDTPHGRIQLGGYAWFDAATLTLHHELPVAAWQPSGRVVTFNAVHSEPVAAGVALTCVVDDIDATLSTWTSANPPRKR
jgi:hypothetical protein